MPGYVALLRAVNVGGTGKLAMPVLAAVCRDAGFVEVATYIASGNVVFRSAMDEAGVRSALRGPLLAVMGREVGVLVRSAAEMEAVLVANPFPGAEPNRVMAVFLEGAPPGDLEATLRHRVDEEVRPGLREVYVHYPRGQGQSRLVVPGAEVGTARNLNTVRKLAAMAREREAAGQGRAAG